MREPERVRLSGHHPARHCPPPNSRVMLVVGMRFERHTAGAIAAVLGLSTVVILLAMLQYQWTGEISRGAEERMREALAASVRRFREDFSREMNRIAAAFQPDPAAPPAQIENSLLSRYGDFVSSYPHYRLLANLLVWRIDGRTPRLLLMDRQSFRFVEIAWPPRLERLREHLNEQSWELSWISEREAYRHPWTLHEPTPALVQALFRVSPGERAPAAETHHIGFLILELDRPRLSGEFLPMLASRHFGPPGETSFLIAVRAAGNPAAVLYESDPRQPVSRNNPDAEADLLDPRQDRWDEPVGAALTPSSKDTQWRLAVQHRAGSLAAAVGALRRRNLAVSFSLLSLLAASVALILVLARRTQRLAALQMEFVAGVSHELRSPLSVICAAADNLAEGVVTGPERSRQYGDLIRTEGRRLSRMVEQALLFAAEQADRIHFNLQPVQARQIIESVLQNAEPALRQASMKVETDLPATLPPVLADANALGQCLENLISNAVKYAAGGGWLALRAGITGKGPQRELAISVEDKGPGLSHSDLAHIFEPFYRSKSAREAQVKGAGLGLYLVRRMMEGMGGRVTVWSRPGRGARFTLHLPLAESEPKADSEGTA